MRVACVGSKQLTPSQLDLCFRIGAYLARQGDVVVSGGAIGADQAFAQGAASVCPARVHLYLPWPSYERGQVPPGAKVYVGPDDHPEDLRLAQLHPRWAHIKDSVRLLMLRNAHIVRTSGCVIAYPRLDEAHRWTGGTAHALTVAKCLGRQLRP